MSEETVTLRQQVRIANRVWQWTLLKLESLYPSLPGEDESETEINKTNPQSVQQQILQRLEQMEVDSRARDAVMVEIQRNVLEVIPNIKETRKAGGNLQNKELEALRKILNKNLKKR